MSKLIYSLLIAFFAIVNVAWAGEKNCTEKGCKNLPKCNDVINQKGFTGQCRNSWSAVKPLVKPTQPEVGYGWIKLKLEKDYKTAKKAEENTKMAPAVIGPSPDGPRFYIVDDHHTLCALDYSGHDVTVVFDILCDKRDWSYDAFWASLASQNLAYLGAHPVANTIDSLPQKIHWSQVPATFSFTKKDKALRDDPWRSLGGFARKVESDTCPESNKRCMRCMFRGCSDGYSTSDKDPGVAFFEFRWAYFLTIATYHSPTLYWDQMGDFHAFITSFDNVYAEHDLEMIDTEKWTQAAAAIVPLCRSEHTAQYELPSDIYALLPGSHKNTLPGYYLGKYEIPNDPVCASPSCRVEANPSTTTNTEL